MSETKVSSKSPAITEGAKTVYNALKTTSAAIENMPECSIKKSLLLTQTAYEKKINAIVKREEIGKMLAIIRANPEKFMEKLTEEEKAEFARSDEGAENVTTKQPKKSRK